MREELGTDRAWVAIPTEESFSSDVYQGGVGCSGGGQEELGVPNFKGHLY